MGAPQTQPGRAGRTSHSPARACSSVRGGRQPWVLLRKSGTLQHGDPRDLRPVDGRTAGAKPCRARRTAPGTLALGSVFPSSCPAPGARPRSWRCLFVPCRRASGSLGASVEPQLPPAPPRKIPCRRRRLPHSGRPLAERGGAAGATASDAWLPPSRGNSWGRVWKGQRGFVSPRGFSQAN